MIKIVSFLLLITFTISCESKKINENQRKEILTELDEIKESDQKYAGVPSQELVDKYGEEMAWVEFKKIGDSIFLNNQNRIKNLYKKYGYLGYEEVGKEASQAFWLSIQHADNDVPFQQEMLAALKVEIENDNASKVDYAMLEDRINVNLNQKQRFGSQVDYNENYQAVAKVGLIDLAEVHRLRQEYGLQPLNEYYNEMTKMFFELNKESLIANGITSPPLYQ